MCLYTEGHLLNLGAAIGYSERRRLHQEDNVKHPMTEYQIRHAPRHITGRHGHTLEWFREKFRANFAVKSREQKALSAYKAQRLEGRAFVSGPSEKARQRTLRWMRLKRALGQ